MPVSSPTAQVKQNCVEICEEQKHALLERIAASTHFRRSSRLRDLLLFLGSRDSGNNPVDVHEQEIGETVFGRPSRYDCGQDNIVRVYASELRKRLGLYFTEEGADEEFILTMPRGGYRFVFQSRSPANDVELAPVATQSLLEGITGDLSVDAANGSLNRLTRSKAWMLCFLGVVAGLGLGVLLMTLIYRGVPGERRAQTAAHKPLLSAFWSAFSTDSGSIDIVLPDASVNITEYILRKPISLSDYLNRDYYAAALTAHSGAERIADIHEIFNHNIVTLGDFEAAQQLLSLSSVKTRMHLIAARSYTPDSLKQDSLILIGGEPANPWVSLFNKDLNFALVDNDRNMQTYVINRDPRPGEPASFTPALNQDAVLTEYGVIAFLPSPNRVGNILILAGTDAQTTKDVADYFTSEDKLRELQERLGSKRIRYFEAVIRTTRLSNISFSSQIVAFRKYVDMVTSQ